MAPGRKVNPQSKKRRWLLLRPALWEWIDAEAAAAGETVNGYIEAILLRHQSGLEERTERIDRLLGKLEAALGADDRQE